MDHLDGSWTNHYVLSLLTDYYCMKFMGSLTTVYHVPPGFRARDGSEWLVRLINATRAALIYCFMLPRPLVLKIAEARIEQPRISANRNAAVRPEQGNGRGGCDPFHQH